MAIESRNGHPVLVVRPAAPLDATLTLDRYRRWGVDPAGVYRESALYRVARVGAARVPFRLEVAGSLRRPRLAVTFDGPDTPEVRAALGAQARALLGLDTDLAAFYARATADPVLAPLVPTLYGLRPTLTPDPFEMLVGAISAQQVNLAFAFATRARLVRAFGEPAHLDGVTVYAFPAPAHLATATVAELRAMQFSTRKAEYIAGLARLVADGGLDVAALAGVPDEEIVARLTRVRGLGRWTAEWFLARCLGRPDVCPAEDLGVRRAVEAYCFRGRPADSDRVRRRALAWRPHRSLAVHYLLAGLRHRPALDAAGA